MSPSARGDGDGLLHDNTAIAERRRRRTEEGKSTGRHQVGPRVGCLSTSSRHRITTPDLNATINRAAFVRRTRRGVTFRRCAILLAEDDPQLGQRSPADCASTRTPSISSTDGKDAVYRAAINEYDIIVLDYMIPEHRRSRGGAGDSRRAAATRRFSFLTARDAVADRVAGLDAGADDYLVKPFAFEELLARLRALSRRAATVLPTIIAVGDLRIDTRAHRSRSAAREIPLTAKEYALLEFLARNAGAVVSRADITAHVWDDNHDPLSNNLEVFINRVRRRIDDEGARVATSRPGAARAICSPRSARPSNAAAVRMTVRVRLTLWYSALLVCLVVAFAVASYAYL